MRKQFLLNGRFDNSLTPWDRGFAYGDGVFRTIAVHNAKPAGWHRHYRKLDEDCRALGIVCPNQDLLLSEIAQLCPADEKVVVKIIVTRGESLRGYAVPSLAKPSRVLIRTPFPHYPEEYYSQGVKLHLCKIRLAIQPRLAGIKHLNRLENVLARMEWSDAKIADGLLLDLAGNVIECTASNIFIRIGNVVTTPDLASCGVAGVTRQHIMELLPRLGYVAEVDTFTLDKLMQAEEVIVCNSLFGVWQVHQLHETIWPHGNLARQLQKLLQEDDAFTD